MQYKRIVLICCTLALSIGSFAQTTMTDQQIIDYYEQGVAQGKSREQIAAELQLRGVTREQAQRVAAKYQEQQGKTGKSSTTVNKSRAHTTAPRDTTNTRNNRNVRDSRSSRTNRSTRTTQNGRDTGDRTLRGRQNEQYDPNDPNSYDEYGNYLGEEEEEEYEEGIKVWGRDIFRNKDLDFTPGDNMPTPRNYRLGPGDEVIIDIFGAAQQTIRDVISPEGSIVVEYLGPVYLNGMTVEEANSYLRKKLAAIYSSIGQGGRSGTNLRLSVGQIRSIQVNVLGDVLYPGTYSISSFATVLHALYQAGGIVEPGTLRNIRVSREGKTVGYADVYDLLTTGSNESDVRLEDGDVILVTPYNSLVEVTGAVKRPMYFEMKEGETLGTLLSYAGGFTNDANTGSVSIVRQSGKAYQVRTVDAADFPRFVIENGDIVSVGRIQARFENRVAISGAVYLPGLYELNDDMRTLRQLVQKAGGLMPEAFTNRAVIQREHDDHTLESFSVNLARVMNGSDPDFVLRNNDEITIARINDMEDYGTMSIDGMVANPGVFDFASNTTVEDLIVMAGGLLNGASMARVDVTRRVRDPQSMTASKEVAELYSFSIKDGLIADGQGGFTLEPYDEVTVHNSPSYNEQLHVTVEGQVNFPGTYSMTYRNERLSDLIKKAGGLTDFSYAKGARLFRQMSKQELQQLEDAQDMMQQAGNDTTKMKNVLKRETDYQIAIELDKALANPGGPEDIFLRPDDRVEVPLENNVVQVRGAVMAPSSLSYKAGLRAYDYIRRSGGFANRARRSQAYVVSMNGDKKPARSSTKIQPGDEIVVPFKEKKDGSVQASIVSAASAASSLATLSMAIVSVINQTKK